MLGLNDFQADHPHVSTEPVVAINPIIRQAVWIIGRKWLSRFDLLGRSGLPVLIAQIGSLRRPGPGMMVAWTTSYSGHPLGDLDQPLPNRDLAGSAALWAATLARICRAACSRR
jgi:hypothetical protein